MKKYFYLFFVALFATFSLSLTSCSDDNDTKNLKENNKPIYGTWSETIPDTSDLDDEDPRKDTRFPKGGTFSATFSAENNMSFSMNYISDVKDKDGNTIEKNANITKNFTGTYTLKQDDNQGVYWILYEGTLVTKQGSADPTTTTLTLKPGDDTMVKFYTDKETGKEMVSISLQGVRFEMEKK